MADPPPDWTLTRGHWEDRYSVEVLQCAACAQIHRTAWRMNQERKPNVPSAGGLYFAVQDGVR